MRSADRPEETPGDAIKAAWKSRGITQADYARATGRTPQSVNDMVRANMRSDSLIEMAGFAGFDVVLVPRGAKLVDGARVLKRKGEEDGDR